MKHLLFTLCTIVYSVAWGQTDTPRSLQSGDTLITSPKSLNMEVVIQRIGYPRELYLKRIQGVVYAEILVNKKGNVKSYTIVGGQTQHPSEASIPKAHPLFIAAVTKHIRALSFEPALKEHKPIEFTVKIPFRFNISQDRKMPSS